MKVQNSRDHIRKVLSDSGEKTDNTSLFTHIIHHSNMPKSELSEWRLAKEAQALLGGGTVSPARTMAFASYYILSRPDLHAKLQAELAEPMVGWPEKIPTWPRLENLPLLQAVIKESLR